MHITKEIFKFIQEVNIKFGISPNYTVLEVSEVPHWAKMFQVLARMNIQPEAQPIQEPAPNFSVPPLQVNVELSHQQAEINRLHSSGQPKVCTSITNPSILQSR